MSEVTTVLLFEDMTVFVGEYIIFIDNELLIIGLN